MERELLVTGIGGQGVQLATQVLARALTLDGQYVLSLGTYGGTMRGGSTDASLVYGDRPISAPPIVASAWSGLLMHHLFWTGTRDRLSTGAVLVVNTPIFDPAIDLSRFRPYAVPAVEGMQTVTFSGPGLAPVQQVVTISQGKNVKADLRLPYTAPVVTPPAAVYSGVPNVFTCTPVPLAGSYDL